jgi:hypothetical protein
MGRIVQLEGGASLVESSSESAQGQRLAYAVSSVGWWPRGTFGQAAHRAAAQG